MPGADLEGQGLCPTLVDKARAHGAHVLAWIYLCLHRKTVLSSTEWGRNPGGAGGCFGLTAAGPSKHPGMAFLEERAISEIIYLTGIKPVHTAVLNSSESNLITITALPFPEVLSSLPGDPQSSVLCWGCFRWASGTAWPSCSHSTWTNPLPKTLNEVKLKSYETWWPLITPLVQCWTGGPTPQWKWSNSH